MQFFRLYMGIYVHALPEVLSSSRPTTWFEGTRPHVTPQCRSAAVAYESAQFTPAPPGMPGATYVFQNSSIWYSSEAQVRTRLISVLHLQTQQTLNC